MAWAASSSSRTAPSTSSSRAASLASPARLRARWTLLVSSPLCSSAGVEHAFPLSLSTQGRSNSSLPTLAHLSPTAILFHRCIHLHLFRTPGLLLTGADKGVDTVLGKFGYKQDAAMNERISDGVRSAYKSVSDVTLLYGTREQD